MNAPYTTVIGLEVHVQLLTETKLFCGCSTTFGMPPNSQTCPVCLGLPGSLPVMNQRAYELALKAASSLGAEIAPFTKWDRKNYYYPDLPKAYQISQYDLPFSTSGSVKIESEHGERVVRLIRVHLEEDAGKNTHSESGGDSLVDLNRAGTPLLEIVSEPDMRHPEEARAYLETLRILMRDLDVSDCEMQEGSLRCDANVNIHVEKNGKTYKTPIVEIKNMNSIRAVERAISYEAARQYDEWLKNNDRVLGTAPKKTAGWNDTTGKTVVQREKEEASDYRYFPEPDLVPVVVDDAWLDRIRADVGESSAQRMQRFQSDHSLSAYHAEVLISKGRAVSDYFEELLHYNIEPKAAANWVINDLLAHTTGRIKTIRDLAIPANRLAELIHLVPGKLNLNDAREKVLPNMVVSGRPAEEIAKEMDLTVETDNSAIESVIDEVILAMPQAADDVRAGKMKAMGALVGQVMKRSQGKFPPAIVNELLAKKLS